MVTVMGGKSGSSARADRDRKATHNLVERGVRGSRGKLACLGEMSGSLLGDTLEAGLAQTGNADDVTIIQMTAKKKRGPTPRTFVLSSLPGCKDGLCLASCEARAGRHI